MPFRLRARRGQGDKSGYVVRAVIRWWALGPATGCHFMIRRGPPAEAGCQLAARLSLYLERGASPSPTEPSADDQALKEAGQPPPTGW